jgi:hypothetical protein
MDSIRTQENYLPSQKQIKDLQSRLIGPLNDLKTPKPNPRSDCYLYEAQIRANTLDVKQLKPILVRLLHNPNQAGLFANTQTPVEHRFDLTSLVDGLVKPLTQFFQKFKKDNLTPNKNHNFPTTLELETSSVSPK